MKTTRAKLVEFIRSNTMTTGHTILWIDPLADKLIESGLVQVEEEPREFWIKLRGLDIEDTHSLPIYTTDPNAEIIHVHSVDQCKKYEKMLNKLKNKLLGYVPESTFSPYYIMTLIQKIEKGE